VACASFLLPLAGNAAEIKWNVDEDGSWFVGDNWTGKKVPGPMDDAVDDIGGTDITQKNPEKTISVKSLTLKKSSLQFNGTLIAKDGVKLEGGGLAVGFKAGGTIQNTEVSGSGMVSFSKSPNNALSGASFSGVHLRNTGGGTVLVEGGLKFSRNERFEFGGGSSIVFNGTQTLSNGAFQLSGTSTIGLKDGTALTISFANFKLLNENAPASTTIGNISTDATKPTKILFAEGNTRIEPDKNLSDNPVSVTLAANEIVVNKAGLFLSLGSDATKYKVFADKFTNSKSGFVAAIASTGGTHTFDVGTFTNSGKFMAASAVDINTEQFANDGTYVVLVGNASRVQVGQLAGKGAAAINKGTLTVEKNANLSFLTGFVQKAGKTTVDGNLDIKVNDKKATGRLDGGVVGGTGTVNGNLKVVDGIVKPGNSPGVLTINGNYDQETGGTLAIEIDRGGNGPIACDGPGCYSQLVVSGDITLANGMLDVTLDAAPVAGDLFGIIDNLHKDTPIKGTFDGLLEDGMFTADFGGFAYLFEISYEGNVISPSQVTFDGGNDVVLQVIRASPVPEPSSLMALLSGVMTLAACGWLRRRQESRATSIHAQ
jgi:hypothetical protein